MTEDQKNRRMRAQLDALPLAKRSKPTDAKFSPAETEIMLARGAKPVAWNTIPRKAGRPPKPDTERLSDRCEIRMTEAQGRKLLKLGGAQWVRDRIDKAKLP